MKLTLNSKVTIFITVIVLTASIASTSFLFDTYRRGMVREITARGTTMAESLALGVAEGIASENLGIIQQVQSIVQTRDVILAQVYSSVWLPIDSYPDNNFSIVPDPAALRLLEATHGECCIQNRDDIDCYAPVFYHHMEQPKSAKYIIGYVRIKLSTREVTAVIQQHVLAYLGYSLLFTLAAIVILHGLTRRIVLTPIERLNQAVSGAVNSDSFVPVPVAGSDEIGELSSNVNKMFAAIQERGAERKQAEASLRKLEKLEALGVLAGGIAHDFNNVLTAILGNLSFARSLLDDSHKAAAILVKAEKATDRAAELAHQLLTFAKGGQPVKKAALIQPILEESASFVLRGANVSSVLEWADDLLAVEVDPGQISQVANNIIINAAQAMPGGGTISIRGGNTTVSAGNRMALAPGEYVRITITDKGCGISEENQKRIFDPYFTTKPGGSGLGLASAHSIVTRHGGYLGVRSAPGLGATFEILLPASRQAALPDGVPARWVAARGQTGSVLVMDDEEIIRDMVAAMMAELGYQVETCSHGEAAVSRYQAAWASGSPFSAVIMDLTIPGGMGGREAARHILAFDPGARLIVSSGYSNDPIMAEFAQHGFCATLTKPYAIAGIARTLNLVLAGAQVH